MTTMTDIRNDLIDVFNGLKAGTLEAKDAVEINNTAGKIISSAKVQIAYHALRNEAPNIPFLAAPVDLPALENKSADVERNDKEDGEGDDTAEAA